jgi:UDP-N-acetylglucosamine acyltransferase
MKIHPTAIVSPTARLADDVEIGAGAIIGDGVEIGPGCVIQARAVVEGGTRMGSGNFVGYGAVIGAPPQDYAHTPEVQSGVLIGDNNRIREYATIHRGTKEGTLTKVGNGCFLMVGCHLGHNAEIGDSVVLVNNVLLAGYVQVGDGAVLGGGSVFHQFMRIGKKAMVSGGSQFNKDIPPYTMAKLYNILAGLNVVGLRRAGISAESRADLQRAFHLIFRGNQTISAALESARERQWGPEAMEFLDFVASSKRGCCTTHRSRQQSNEQEEG